MTTVTWLGKPVPWKRTSGSGKRRYTEPAYRAWKDSFGWAAKAAHEGNPWNESCAVAIQVASDGVKAVFVLLSTETGLVLSPIVERPKGVRGDIDNYVKAVMDSVQKIVITDDRLIVAVYASFTDTIR